MSDVVLDTGALADILAQYFTAKDRDKPIFTVAASLSNEAVKQINRIIREEVPNVVVASTMAFVELARQWNKITAGRFQPYQLAAFLDTPPQWFSVDPIDETLLPFLRIVPSQVILSNGDLVQIEWTDAIHVATKLSRDNAQLASTDRKIWRVEEILGGNLNRPLAI